eukprot:4337567-Amphidinium_carterae.1
MAGQIRTLRLELELTYEQPITPAHAVFPWVMRHAAMVYNFYHKKVNSRIAYQDAFAEEYSGEMC